MSSSKRSFDENDASTSTQAKKPRPSQSQPSSSSTPLASSSRQPPPPPRAPTREEVQLGKGTTLNKHEKAIRKKQLEEDRLAAKPTISRWDAPPPDLSKADPKKEKDREKARLKREKDKQEKLVKEREQAEELGKGGKGLMGWVVRKKE